MSFLVPPTIQDVERKAPFRFSAIRRQIYGEEEPFSFTPEKKRRQQNPPEFTFAPPPRDPKKNGLAKGTYIHTPMFTSIFSPFDILYAELSCGQKLGLSVRDRNSKPKAEQNLKPSSSAVDFAQKKQEASRSSSTTAAASPAPTRTRFAPELDGVYCFETILPY
ncbi:Avr9/Cf-9 rapidly elicited protein 65 [Senna tora]|uniref:Avr9/Cf-9 rapidly elicited protein 65 n=1 Tax=Senna tora TaxID=362788 RepID=A0A834X1P2_9FABA|nr:Avr9/Cf-9 rapidly elicited protein 65 [Senna tora]